MLIYLIRAIATHNYPLAIQILYNIKTVWCRTEAGIIDEFIYGIGKSGKTYTFGEKGKEMIVPLDVFNSTNGPSLVGSPLSSKVNNAIDRQFTNISASSIIVNNSTVNNAVECTTDRIIQQMNTYNATTERMLSNTQNNVTSSQRETISEYAGDFDREIHIHVDLDHKEIAHAIANLSYDLHRDISKRKMRSRFQQPARFS